MHQGNNPPKSVGVRLNLTNRSPFCAHSLRDKLKSGCSLHPHLTAGLDGDVEPLDVATVTLGLIHPHPDRGQHGMHRCFNTITATFTSHFWAVARCWKNPLSGTAVMRVRGRDVEGGYLWQINVGGSLWQINANVMEDSYEDSYCQFYFYKNTINLRIQRIDELTNFQLKYMRHSQRVSSKPSMCRLHTV